MEEMYRELILDHARNRRHWGLIENPDFDHEEHNPLCGDKLHLTLKLDEQGVIQAVGWEGSGCAISQASASMLGEHLVGMTLEDAKKLHKNLIFEMIGIPLTINRVKCATLALKTLIVGAQGSQKWEQVEDED